MKTVRIFILLAAVGGLALMTAACHPGRDQDDGCLDCHGDLEVASSSHSGCTGCHGGNPGGKTARAAHRGIYGLANPSYSGRWEKGCGPCHRQQVERLRSNQMFTNAGMIAQIQATWEGMRDSVVFAAHADRLYDAQGDSLEYTSVLALNDLSGELYRKFCGRCHLGRQNDAEDGAGHPAGCSACHFPFAPDAAYHGADPTMRSRAMHSNTHTLQELPPMAACQVCHQRSGRIALAYQGLNDGNNGLVPTLGGMPGPVAASDMRNYSHIAQDVHFMAGMECIDCHTSREIMGEGYAAPDMHGQLEIRCEDCHGDETSRPRTRAAWRENAQPLRESRHYGRPLAPGTRFVLTSRNRPYSNVFADSGRVRVMLKRSGKVVDCPVITGTPEHTIAGHERMECHTCHSRTVVQCYGCHTLYDRQEDGWDFIAGRATPGAFSETEDVRTLYPFPLALNREGLVSTVTPGCQTFVTVIDTGGVSVMDEEVLRFRGRRQLRFAPFFGHNVGKKSVSCAACHGNPAFLGFGQHIIENGMPRGTLLCEKDPRKSLDGFLTEKAGSVAAYAAISRTGGRPLDDGEVRRVWRVNLCLICHDKAADPIYRAPLEYGALRDSLHRRLLAADAGD